MVLDERLLAEAESASARITALERETAAATSQYHRTIRRLHVAGSSMREIADALQLSHQRVHQIVDAAGGAPRRWKLRSKPPRPLVCSFCEKAKDDVTKLVAGAAAYMCGDCVEAAASFDKVHAASTLRCSFCTKPRKAVTRMVAGAQAQICDDCLHLCKEICENA